MSTKAKDSSGAPSGRVVLVAKSAGAVNSVVAPANQVTALGATFTRIAGSPLAIRFASDSATGRSVEYTAAHYAKITAVNRRTVFVLVLTSCVMDPFRPAFSLGAAGPFLSAERQDARSSASPESFEKLAESARAAMDADRVPEAIRLYGRATALRPDWPEGWWHLGTLLFDGSRFREARDAFAHFVSTEKKQPGPGFGMLGLSEIQLKDYAKALAALERGIHLGLGPDPAFNRRVLIQDGLQTHVQLAPLAQQFIELRFTQNTAKRGLSQLRDREAEISDAVGGEMRIEHLHVQHGVHPHLHVVAGDANLFRDVDRDFLETVPVGYLLEERYQDVKIGRAHV